MREVIKPESRRAGVYISSLWMLTLAGAAWGAGIYLSRAWPPSSKVGLVVFFGLLAVSLSHLADAGRESRSPLLADLCGWIGESKGRNFLLGSIAASYVLFLHPYIVDQLPSASLMEWGIVCLIAWCLYRSLNSRLEELHCLPLILSSWERHTQKLVRKEDERIRRLSSLQAEFVEDGNRDRLLTYLSQILRENGWAEARIKEILSPLSVYREERRPWPWKRRIKYRNLRIRQRILEEIINQIAERRGNP